MIPSPVDSPHKMSARCFFHVCLNELLNSRVASELKSDDAYASYVNPTFRMVEHQDNYVAIISKVYRAYQKQKAPIQPAR